MQVDTNTKGHQQWFYFRVRNTQAKHRYVFKIMNFTKPGIPNKQNVNGQRQKNSIPQKLHYKSKKDSNQEWQILNSDNIEYIKTNVQRNKKDVLISGIDSDQEDEELLNEKDSKRLNWQSTLNQNQKPKRKKKYYYALIFEFEFQHSDDTVYFSFALPYTYTQLIQNIYDKETFLLGSEKDFKNTLEIDSNEKRIFYKREELCRSLCQLPLYVITIGRDHKSYKKNPIIVITSRVHSGETPGSYVFQGIYNFLLSDSKEAKALTKFYTFILIPFLNPDGVICGNYRNSISGVDLNRQWILPDQDLHPEIYYTKNLLKTLYGLEKRHIWIFCDLHGHSKKKNSFFYGCNTAANGGFLSWTIVRLLPRILAKKTHLFNFKDCRFKVDSCKIGTGRVVAWKQFMITHSFTLETSFYGYNYGEENKIFEVKDYNEIGHQFCLSVYDMHFLWKEIMKEFKLTKGWLKPRKLIEITGTPAAQLLNEQLALKKKDEIKKKAIEQYEQFLKKYFHSTPQKKNNKLYLQSTYNKKPIDSINSIKLQSNRNNQQQQKIYSQLTNTDSTKSRNILCQSDNSSLCLTGTSYEKTDSCIKKQDDKLQSESIQNYFQGLIKIQAWIRGYLVRKNIDEQQYNFSKIKVDVATYQIRQENKLDNNWRQFFQENELEEAYQHIEIHKVDFPEELSSSGSESDPSLDNFDQREIYERIYEINNNADIKDVKKDLTKKFQQELQNIQIDQNYYVQIMQNSKIKNELENSKDITQLKNANIANLSKNTIKLSNQSQFQLKPTQQQQLNNQAQYQYQNQQEQPFLCITKVQKETQRESDLSYYTKGINKKKYLYQTSLNFDKQLQLKKSNTQSPIDNPNNYLNDTQLHQKFVDAQNAFQIQPIENQNTMLGNLQQLHQKLLISQMMGKRENMHQIVKDCFITKKCQPNSEQKRNQLKNTSLISGQKHKNFKQIYQNQRIENNRALTQSKSPHSTDNVRQRHLNKQLIQDNSDMDLIEGNIKIDQQQNEDISSHFLKYLKQKLVKTIKNNQFPHFIIDKNLNLLIDQDHSQSIYPKKDNIIKGNQDLARNQNNYQYQKHLKLQGQNAHIQQHDLSFIQEQPSNYQSAKLPIIQKNIQSNAIGKINNIKSTQNNKNKINQGKNDLIMTQVQNHQSSFIKQSNQAYQSKEFSQTENRQLQLEEYLKKQNFQEDSFLQSNHSLESSVDQDMIDNIKNIYQEMKKNSVLSMYQTFQNKKQPKNQFIQARRIRQLEVANTRDDHDISMTLLQGDKTQSNSVVSKTNILTLHESNFRKHQQYND